MNRYADILGVQPAMKHTVRGGYLYRGIEIDHLGRTAIYKEWLINWPDGSYTDCGTLRECRHVINEAFKTKDRGCGDG